eukprot:TRINITY_DN53660_c0_g1_i1.p1 TRINITY_DN53660_c0_g1~~TRINITY_DN53660_c0_g1_i1.p1  ORF type:complete len:345 (-),score=46.83 TRINITY_DN53660_c0_g1_i1:103-1086(-)
MLLFLFMSSMGALFTQHAVSQDTTMLLAADDECSSEEQCGLSALQTKSTMASTTSESCDSWGCSCQGVSDCFGVVVGMSWGAAPPAAQVWFYQHGCVTVPSGAACKSLSTGGTHAGGRSPVRSKECEPWDCSCQGMSDCFGVIYGTSWGAASQAGQSWYNQNGCTTRPSGSECKGKAAVWYPPGKEGQSIWTVYHTTSPQVGPKILKHGFKPGHVGWCGGGIYFATSREGTAAKAIGVDSSQGFLIEAQVDVGKVWYKQWNCFTDQACISSRPGVQGHLSCMSNRTFDDVSEEVHGKGFNSIVFDPGDGYELLIYDPKQVISMRHIS